MVQPHPQKRFSVASCVLPSQDEGCGSLEVTAVALVKVIEVHTPLHQGQYRETVGFRRLCVLVTGQVVLHHQHLLRCGHARETQEGLGADAGALLGDGGGAHHRLTVTPLEVAGALGGAVVMGGVCPHLAQGQREVLGHTVQVVPIGEGWRGVLEHTAAG